MSRTRFLLPLLVALAPSPTLGAEPSNAEEAQFELPPVPVDELRVRAPQPSWDTALLYAACGVSEPQPWGKTKFCLGGMADVLWGRRAETESGWGGYVQASTAGFRDARLSLGPAAVISLIEWFALGLRGGALMQISSQGATPGFEGYLELGHRSVSHKSRYSISHSLFGGIQHAVGTTDSPANNVIWIGLRIDGMWVTTPAALFK